jgi:magnesium-transporting ATPase (P-type)
MESEGFNELPRAQTRSPLRIVLDVLREPVLALLLAGGLVYLLVGSRAEALILLAFACLSVGITVVQEARTERVLEALRDLTSPRALVIRGESGCGLPGARWRGAILSCCRKATGCPPMPCCWRRKRCLPTNRF